MFPFRLWHEEDEEEVRGEADSSEEPAGSLWWEGDQEGGEHLGHQEHGEIGYKDDDPRQKVVLPGQHLSEVDNGQRTGTGSEAKQVDNDGEDWEDVQQRRDEASLQKYTSTKTRHGNRHQARSK